MSEKINQFEELYLKEKKKGQLLTTAVATLALLVVVTGVYAFQKPNQPARNNPNGDFQQVRLNGDELPGGSNGLRMQMDITDLLNDDGSVDTDEVKQMTDRLPAAIKENFLERMEEQIDEAKEDGEITAAQAAALKDAFDI